MALSHEQILAALERPDVATKEVHVPELGGEVRIREMSAAVRNRFEAVGAAIRSGGDGTALDQITAHIVSACVLDDRDRPMLTVNEVKRLMGARPRAVFRLRDAIIDLSGLDDNDVEEMAEVFGDRPTGPTTSA